MRRLVALLMGGVLAWALFGDSGQFVLAEALGIRFGIASGVGLAGLYAGARSWTSLVGVSHAEGLIAVGGSLPLRHIPMGGLGQVLGLAGVTSLSGVSRGALMQLTPLFVALSAAGASLVASPILFFPTTPWWLRLVVATGLAGTAILLVGGVQAIHRLTRRWAQPESIERRTLVVATAWSTTAAFMAAVGFTVVIPFSTDVIVSISGWSAAWLCGYVFVISPAGLGVREAVLMSLWPDIDVSTIVATALVHRVSTLMGEAVLFIASWRLSRLLVTRYDEPGA